MSNEEVKKPRLNIHIGGLIIFIIIILLLFKVDIKSKIQSPQFQENITYIETQAKTFWQKYISDPFKSKTGEVLTNTLNKGVEKIQNNLSEGILKNTTIEE